MRMASVDLPSKKNKKLFRLNLRDQLIGDTKTALYGRIKL